MNSLTKMIKHTLIVQNRYDKSWVGKWEDEDDEPMTMQEVLEEVCKYLNVTAVADGDKVYFLDYDAIKNGINTFVK